MTFIFPWRSSIFRKSNKCNFIFLDSPNWVDKAKYFVDELKDMHINNETGICHLYVILILAFTLALTNFLSKVYLNHSERGVGVILTEKQLYVNMFWEKAEILTFVSE